MSQFKGEREQFEKLDIHDEFYRKHCGPMIGGNLRQQGYYELIVVMDHNPKMKKNFS